jgi:hypothetical protein
VFWLNYSNPQSTVITFEITATPSHDVNWTGTADSEPNDTAATATPLAPDVTVTGNVGATTHAPEDSAIFSIDGADVYRFTVLERAEVEVTLFAVCDGTNWTHRGNLALWLRELDGAEESEIPDIRASIYGAGVFPRTVTESFTLQPGDYKILIEAHGGTGRDLIAYELTLYVVSGEVEIPQIVTLPEVEPLAHGINVTVDGRFVYFAGGQGPELVGGRTLVPVRGVFETLGFEVDWDAPTRTAILTRTGQELRIGIDLATFTLNGVSHVLDVPAQIIGGRTMVPIRLPLESIGYNLDWDSVNQIVQITR